MSSVILFECEFCNLNKVIDEDQIIIESLVKKNMLVKKEFIPENVKVVLSIN